MNFPRLIGQCEIGRSRSLLEEGAVASILQRLDSVDNEAGNDLQPSQHNDATITDEARTSSPQKHRCSSNKMRAGCPRSNSVFGHALPHLAGQRPALQTAARQDAGVTD